MTIEALRKGIHSTALRIATEAGTGAWSGERNLARRLDTLRLEIRQLERLADALHDRAAS